MRTPPIDLAAPAPPGRDHPAAARPRQTFLQILEMRDERAPRPSQAPPAGAAPLVTPAGAAPAGPGAAVRTLMTRTFRAEAHLDRMLASAAAGKTFSAGQLLALQATAFRYSQTVEVLSRGADRLVGAMKQMLGTQV